MSDIGQSLNEANLWDIDRQLTEMNNRANARPGRVYTQSEVRERVSAAEENRLVWESLPLRVRLIKIFRPILGTLFAVFVSIPVLELLVPPHARTMTNYIVGVTGAWRDIATVNYMSFAFVCAASAVVGMTCIQLFMWMEWSSGGISSGLHAGDF